MTLKLEGDLDILKMYLYNEYEVARSRHSKLLIMDEICTANETKIAVNVKGQMSPTNSSIHQAAYSYQVTSISDQ